MGPVLEELDDALEVLRETAERVLGDRVAPWVVGYFVYLAVK